MLLGTNESILWSLCLIPSAEDSGKGDQDSHEIRINKKQCDDTSTGKKVWH